uniref:MND1-interacting protein 1-like n=1 Tax=Erigeron canadensis TaxID=72917 RepID=UPI001CB95576|nr:MND1-interacting protein 1-like [Erigeron canadensis]
MSSSVKKSSVQKPKPNKKNNSDKNSKLGFNNEHKSNTYCGDDDCLYCREKHLEKMLLIKLDIVYNLAFDKLIGLGYDKDAVMKGILRCGFCNGKMDAVSNIVSNVVGYFDKSVKGGKDTKQVFDNLSMLLSFSVAFLVCMVRREKEEMSKEEAMWRLVMCDLHVDSARDMNVGDEVRVTDAEVSEDGMSGVSPDSCRFSSGWGFGKIMVDEFHVKRPVSRAEFEKILGVDRKGSNDLVIYSNEKLISRINGTFAEEDRAKIKKRQADSDGGSGAVCNGGQLSVVETEGVDSCASDLFNEIMEKMSVKNNEGIDTILKQFYDLTIEGDKESADMDQKDEMLLSLVNEIVALEGQVKERREWAHQKAMQAARKLAHDLAELKMLRMEREENQKVNQEKPTVDDSTMKRLSEMENSLRKVSGQMGRGNLIVRRLEVENAEIRAETEASKLSASESMTLCLSVAKREKKYLKKVLAWEKQRAKLQEDITAEKQKLIELQEERIQVEAATKTAEAQWREERRAKESALAQVEVERRRKEETDATNKRKNESLCSKIKLDFQRYKDDLQRLEQELSCIRTSTNPDQQLTNSYGFHLQDGTIANMLSELDDVDETEAIDRACIICQRHEVSVVLLPCAHQVLCISCNVEYRRAICPICSTSIEQRIRVFGASS